MKFRVALFYILAITLGLGVWITPANDFDLGWQLLGGRWIFEHHTVPTADFINAFNPSWHDYHWLAQVAMYKLYAWGGFDALRLGLGLLMAYVAKILVDIIFLASNREPRISHLASFFFSWWLIQSVAAIRPQMIAVCLVALALRRLIQSPNKFELLYLLVLAVLMVNIHVYWIFVPFLWVIYRRFGSVHTSKRYQWGGFLLLLGAGFVSPYAYIQMGAQPPFLFINYALLWDYLNISPRLRELVMEFKGALAVSSYLWILVLAYIIVVANYFRMKHFAEHRSDWLSSITAIVLSLRAIKFISILGLFGLPILVRALDQLESGICDLLESRFSINRAMKPLFSLLCTGWIALAIYHGAACIPWRCNNDSILRQTLPLTACEKLLETPMKPTEGRSYSVVLTHFNFGGWCRWAMYEKAPEQDIKVTTDGRTQWVPPRHYDISFDLFDIRGKWHEVLAAWKPNAAVVPTGTPLYQAMLSMPEDWKLIYEDRISGAFVAVNKS
jgi:hypothetical protein